MGIFSKKECSICGDASGLLSNRKLADGNLCKECRARLSPFYNLTGKDTVAGVAAQLAYREQNLAELDRFRPTVAVGGAGKVFIDMEMGKFTLASEDELHNGNPDLFDLSGLRSCTLEVRERYNRGDDDEPSSYDYDFYLKFSVDHPFVRNFTYGYSGVTVSTGHRIKESEVQKIYYGQKEMKTGLSAFFSGVSRKAMESYLNQYSLAQDMIEALTGAAAAFRSGQGYVQPAAPIYRQSQEPVYQQPVYPQPAAPAPQAANFCPNCGARVEGGAFCPQCGTRL